MLIKNLLLILLAYICVSCVGTVQETATPKTVLKEQVGEKINFGGVVSVKGIADDKAEVFFYPAQGGSGKYDYIFYFGDVAVPYTVPSEILKADYRGQLKYTVTGLNIAQAYVVKVEARDQISKAKDTNDAILPMTTFTNDVADFMGITSVSNPQGIDGLDSIKVRWAHAFVDFANVTGTAGADPKSYEIVAVNADLLTPADMDNTAKTEAQGRYVKVVDYNASITEVIMRGLPSNKKFYVRVRAIHKDSIDNFVTLRLRSELNTNYLEISTLSSGSPQFDTNSVVVSRNSGVSVTSSLIVNWGSALGVFDHFRIYYGDLSTSVNSSVITDGCVAGTPVLGVYCKKVESNLNSAIIANLNGLTTYQVMVVVCQNSACSAGQRVVADIKTGSTTPTLGGFTGIGSISLASNVNELGKLILNYSPPDFSLGYFDGFIIAFNRDKSLLVYDEITEVPYTGNLVVQPYNYALDSKIIIENISYSDGMQSCFNIYPFVYDGALLKVSYNQNKWLCEIPVIKAPTKSQFPGINQGFTSNASFTVRWPIITKGIYTEFEIYWRKTAGGFDFDEAKTETSAGNFTNYGKAISPGHTTQFTLGNIANGNYRVGVLSRYVNPQTINDGNPDNDIYRSEYNTGIFTCPVINGQSNSCF
ncbi:MAG: hypothetical protein ACOYL6_08165 [Bacteriovoracaceae bacterium]